MNVRSVVALVVTAAMVSCAVRTLTADQAKPSATPRLVVITAGDPVGEKMSYSRDTIVAKPGERLRIRLVSVGQLPRTVMTHNWVLLALGTDAQAFADAAAQTPATGYIPASMKSKILAQTQLVGPGEQSEVILTVPAKPGSYPYVCTFAGHYAAGMKGTLVVK